jgi:hypothetical protein
VIKINRKTANIFEFFKSTIAINYAISLLALFFIGLSGFFIVSISFGFVFSIVIKEVKDNQYYLFYFNNGISKLQLWLFSYVINFLFSMVFVIIFNFIKLLF